MRDESVRGVVDLVRQRPDDVVIIAVDGHSAAGKSTFARAVAAELDAALVHGDDFYRVMDEDERAALTPEQGADQYYDCQRLRSEVLIPLRRGRSVQFRPYDWAANRLATDITTIPPARRVVVEGLFVSRPELADVVDLAVLVTADAALRRRRQLARADASPEWLARWDAAERWYFDQVREPDSYDLVIST
ncbi:uridine kinase family protein [Microlunatus elymi]|uniref:uridine kinase family protein n=1 Tax=Microlunatus elymi TaxID=2596828 RepID=UPI00143D31EE|nr:AAA family ATPase [Microlunatus elymi]